MKLVYRCMEPTCINSDLICPKCDVYPLNGNHFSHSYCYILPLLFTDSYQEALKDIKNQTTDYLLRLENLKNKLEYSLKAL